MLAADCCILNAGSGAWAFAEVAEWLRDTLGIDSADRQRRVNYLLQHESRPGGLRSGSARTVAARDSRFDPPYEIGHTNGVGR